MNFLDLLKKKKSGGPIKKERRHGKSSDEDMERLTSEMDNLVGDLRTKIKLLKEMIGSESL